MNAYETQAFREMQAWQKAVQRRPGILSSIGSSIQARLNRIIPEKVHQAITAAFKVLTNFMLKGSDFFTKPPLADASLQEREEEAAEKIANYKNAAMAEGALTGAGGFVLGLADLPLWLTIKIKMLCHLAALYGQDTGHYHERLYILYTLSLHFSSRAHKRKVYAILSDWERYIRALPLNKEEFDWRVFQQEYRDYLDIAKMLQLVPGIGAAVGAYVNNKHTDALGKTAMNVYRMRWFGSDRDSGVHLRSPL